MYHEQAFHGIGENFLIMESILKNGILSDSTASGIDSYFSNTNSAAKINSRNGVSVVYEFNSGAYNSYIKNGGISFLIADTYGDTNRPGAFPGESIVQYSIDPDHIVGLIVNSKILNKKIEDFTFIQPHEASGQWINKARHIKRLIESKLDTTIEDNKFDDLLVSLSEVQNDSSLDLFDRMHAEKAVLSQINSSLGIYASSMFTVENGIEEPTMLDVINAYNTEKLPVFDVDLSPLDISLESNSSNELENTTTDELEVDYLE